LLLIADHHLIHCSLAHQLKIGSLGEVPADQPISGFIGTPLPGAVRISKIGLHPKLFLQTGMQVMFTAIIQGGGLPGQLGPSAKEEDRFPGSKCGKLQVVQPGEHEAQDDQVWAESAGHFKGLLTIPSSIN
jgi:hypothetical protein